MFWAGAIATPFVWLLGRQQTPEAVIWLLAGGGMLLWDVKQIMGGFIETVEPEIIEDTPSSPPPTRNTAPSPSDPDVMFIGDESDSQARAGNLELRWKS